MLKSLDLIHGRIMEVPSPEAHIYVYVRPDEKEKYYLIKEMAIDEHTLNSALDPDELGRIEFEEDHLAVIMKMPKRSFPEDQFLFKPVSLGFFLYPDKLIVVSREDVPWDDKAYANTRSIQEILLKTFHDCVLHFENHLKAIYKISDEIESKIATAFSNENLVKMFRLERSLIYYLDAIDSNTTVMELIKINATKLKFSKESQEFLEDLIIENKQCYRQANFFAEALSNLMDAWASIINNNLNIRIKLLTILSISLMVPTLIVSVFSMNVPLPLPQHGTLISFWVILTMALGATMTIVMTSFYRKF